MPPTLPIPPRRINGVPDNLKVENPLNHNTNRTSYLRGKCCLGALQGYSLHLCEAGDPFDLSASTPGAPPGTSVHAEAGHGADHAAHPRGPRPAVVRLDHLRAGRFRTSGFYYVLIIARFLSRESKCHAHSVLIEAFISCFPHQLPDTSAPQIEPSQPFRIHSTRV